MFGSETQTGAGLPIVPMESIHGFCSVVGTIDRRSMATDTVLSVVVRVLSVGPLAVLKVA